MLQIYEADGSQRSARLLSQDRRSGEESSGTQFSEEQARKILNEIRELSGDEPIRHRSLAEYAAEWLKSKKLTASEATFIRYSGVVGEFVAHVGKQRAEASIDAVSPAHVKAFAMPR